MDDQHLELIQRQIDGDNSPEESAALEAFLNGNPDAKALHDDLSHVAGMLDGVEAREPPSHLKQAILDALPQAHHAKPQRKERFNPMTALIDGMRAKPRFAFAYTFGLGLVVGLVGYAIASNASQPLPADASGLQGALIGQGPALDIPEVDEVPIEASGVVGTVKVRAGPDLVVVELALEVQETVEAKLTFDEEAFSLRAFSQLNDGPETSVSAAPGIVRLTTSGGNTHFFVLNNHGAATTVHLELMAGENVLFQRTLGTQSSGS